MRRGISVFVTFVIMALCPLFAEDGIHVLQREETVYGVARRYGVSVDLLLSHNNITADAATSLPVGLRLRIPGTYTVQAGEYPFSIAEKFGVNWLELLEINGLSRTDVVRPGDVLVIPGRSQTEPIVPTDTQESVAVTPQVERESSVSDPDRATWPHLGRRVEYDGRFTAVVIEGSPGDEIASVTAGTVSYVGPFSTFGRMVMVRSSSGYQYVYMGAETILVSIGERVEIGVPLALVGYSTGLEGTNVLFTVWNGNRFVHPSVAPRG